MSAADLPPYARPGDNSNPRPSRTARIARIALWTAAVLIVAYGILLAVFWPFTQRRIAQRLSEETSSDVRFSNFRATYFPPGCVIRQIEVRPANDPASPAIVTIDRLTVTSGYRLLWRHRVQKLHLEDVRVKLVHARRSATASGAGANGKQSSQTAFTSIAEVTIDNALLEYPRRDKPPLVFPIHRLTLNNVVRDQPISFHVDMDNAMPPGHVQGDGQFDPWKARSVAETVVSGSYTYSDAHLDSLPGVGGTLSSQGSFAGPANALRVEGATDTPEFRVKSAGHPVHLRTDFQAVVNCSNGDVTLQSVRAQFRGTGASFRGDIKRAKGAPARVASLQIDSTQGRIEDLLWLFSQDGEPAMMGPVAIHAHVVIPGGKLQFIQRVRLQGEFKIDQATFTKPDTQAKVNVLSSRGVGQKAPKSAADIPDPPANLQGQLDLLDAVAHFSRLSFSVPGALAKMEGAYNLSDERVNLQGQLVVDKKLSKTANGLPSHVISWIGEKLFAKSTGAGEILPIKLTGTYDHPSFGLQK